MSVKINQLQIENLKKIKTFTLDLTKDSMTIVGGRNASGKTSCLDGIAWSLGGDKFRPTNPDNTETKLPAKTKLTLSNGLVVERAGKNGTLKVTDPKGMKGGQSLLNSFISTFALDLPSFLSATSTEKAKILYDLIGVEVELTTLEDQELFSYEARAASKKEIDRLKANFDHMPEHDLPEKIGSATDIQAEIEAIQYANGRLTKSQEALAKSIRELDRLKERISEVKKDILLLENDIKDHAILTVKPLQEKLRNVEAVQRQVQENAAKDLVRKSILLEQGVYDEFNNHLKETREKKKTLLDGVELPLPGLTVQNGALIYNGQLWDCMSGAEQLIVATAIVRQLQPECGFILVDKAEQFDLHQLHEFAKWAEEMDFQIIATRVSESDECTVVIEDGELK